VLYAGEDTETCLFERFGDLSYDGNRALAKTLWYSHSIAALYVPELVLCDLTDSKTLSALQVDLGGLMHHDVSVPQEWAYTLQKHPARFQGLLYRSRFNGKNCLALFDRAGVSERTRAETISPLADHGDSVNWLEKHKIALY
jgi:hypothetical protein